MAPRYMQAIDSLDLMAYMVDQEELGMYPKMVEAYSMLLADGWTIAITNTKRGRCRYSDKSLTVPTWAWNSRSEDYKLWYLCHEMAHAIAGHQANHGPAFMRALVAICPAKAIHNELGYKPYNAMQAGIAPEDF